MHWPILAVVATVTVFLVCSNFEEDTSDANDPIALRQQLTELLADTSTRAKVAWLPHVWTIASRLLSSLFLWRIVQRVDTAYGGPVKLALHRTFFCALRAYKWVVANLLALTAVPVIYLLSPSWVDGVLQVLLALLRLCWTCLWASVVHLLLPVLDAPVRFVVFVLSLLWRNLEQRLSWVIASPTSLLALATVTIGLGIVAAAHYAPLRGRVFRLVRSLSERVAALLPAAAPPPLRRQATPQDMKCTITYDLMRDPVLAADGFSYEREAIERWLNQSNTSPRTNLPLEHRRLQPNLSLRLAIEEYVAERKMLE